MCICFSAFALHLPLSFTFLFSCMKTPSCWKNGVGDSCRCINGHCRIALTSLSMCLSELFLLCMSGAAARYNVGFFLNRCKFRFCFCFRYTASWTLGCALETPVRYNQAHIFLSRCRDILYIVLLLLFFATNGVHVPQSILIFFWRITERWRADGRCTCVHFLFLMMR